MLYDDLPGTLVTDELRPRLNNKYYRQTSNISGTEFQNLNASVLVLQLSLPNPLKPCVKSTMKM